MPLADAGSSACPHCGFPLDSAGDCARCASGGMQDAAAAVLEVTAVETKPRPRAIDNPYLILGLLFVALGPFALPLLVRSRAFSPAVKWLLAVLVVVIFAGAMWIIAYLGLILFRAVWELWTLPAM